MRHAHTDHTPSSTGRREYEFDGWLDAFASDEADDALDRQLFGMRDALTDLRSL